MTEDSNEQLDAAELVAWIAGIFEEDPDDLSEATPRDEVEGWDSLGVLLLMANLDERFGINASEGVMSKLQSVGDIIGLIRDNVEGTSPCNLVPTESNDQR